MRRSPSETWMFSVIFWILCSWLPCLADWQVSCSRYVVQLQQNICHQNSDVTGAYGGESAVKLIKLNSSERNRNIT